MTNTETLAFQFTKLEACDVTIDGETENFLVKRDLADGVTRTDDICKVALDHGAEVIGASVHTDIPNAVGRIVVEIAPDADRDPDPDPDPEPNGNHNRTTETHE